MRSMQFGRGSRNLPTRLLTLQQRLFVIANRRSWTIEANDGVIATAGFLEGFTGAGASERSILLTAMIATVVGCLSVAGTKWSEVAAEREAQVRFADKERADLLSRPEAEFDKLVCYWASKGLSPELARKVSEELTATNPLGAQLETEYGFSEPMPPELPILIGIGAGASYGLGAMIPLTITFLVPVSIEAWAIIAAVVTALAVTSLVASRSAQVSASRMLIRSLTVGATTMAASYGAGILLL